MSDESVPKLRLKPKLAADSADAAQPPAATSTPPVEAVPADGALATEENKTVRLKPRLSVAPMPEETPPASVSTPPLEAAPAAAPIPSPAPAEEASAEKPAVKFSLKPKSAAVQPVAAAEPPPVFPPPTPAPPPFPPPPLLPAQEAEPETDHGAGGEPAEITAIRQASNPQFEPPVAAHFPTPPGLQQNQLAAEEDASFPPRPAGVPKTKAPALDKKKLIRLGGGALAVLLVLGGGAFFFLRTKVEPPPPPRPKVVAKPAPEPVVQAPKIEPAPAPGVEQSVVVQAAPVEKPVVVEAAPVVPKPPPPPPPASPAFKAWVENLHISGVRAGSTTRVFIERTSYAVGDLVNPQLGITFEGYNSETRMLSFKDQTGAIVERRN